MSFFNKTYDVIFYYPQHFNRSKYGTNPFFDPLIAICEENGFSYLLIEEPDSKTPFPRNKKAFRFGFWLYVIFGLRKIMTNFLFHDAMQKEIFIGKIINFISLKNFKANTYITISNSMINLFLGFDKDAQVFDLQHGIIYSWHPGYFKSEKIWNDFLKHDRIGLLLFGNGFKDVFNSSRSYPSKNIFVIGSPTNDIDLTFNAFNKDTILYTLQITNELNEKELKNEKTQLIDFLEKARYIIQLHNLKIALKHHPRFNDVINIDDILIQFPFVTVVNENLSDLSKLVFLHITKSSTSTFELAKASIPTYFIPNEFGNKVFFNEYAYPEFNLNFVEWIDLYRNKNSKFFEFANKINAWSLSFFEPLNKKKFLNILETKRRKLV